LFNWRFLQLIFFMNITKDWLKTEEKEKKFRFRRDRISEAEIMVILIWFNLSGFKLFRHFYLNLFENLKLFFPKIPSYKRFAFLQRNVLVLMNVLMRYLTEKTSQKTDVYYIDFTFLEVCKNQRIYLHKTFKGLAYKRCFKLWLVLWI